MADAALRNALGAPACLYSDSSKAVITQHVTDLTQVCPPRCQTRSPARLPPPAAASCRPPLPPVMRCRPCLNCTSAAGSTHMSMAGAHVTCRQLRVMPEPASFPAAAASLLCSPSSQTLCRSRTLFPIACAALLNCWW